MSLEVTLSESGTQIRIFKDTAKRLRELGRKGETYDDVIQRYIGNGDR